MRGRTSGLPVLNERTLLRKHNPHVLTCPIKPLKGWWKVNYGLIETYAFWALHRTYPEEAE